MHKTILVLLSLFWEQPQSLLGALLYLLTRLWKAPSRAYHRHVVTNTSFGVSLGLFVFSPDSPYILRHELGHGRQSSILGPLYLLLVGIPSFARSGLSLARQLWGRENVNRSEDWYYKGYPEAWADRLGNRIKGLE